MPVINRKRRAVDISVSPPTSQTSARAFKATQPREDLSDAAEGDITTQVHTSREQMVKRLVRLALASEYSRRPIKREDIIKKVMVPNTGRRFRHIFTAANDQLLHTFGMTLTELPTRDRITVAQKRAGQRSTGNKNSSSSHHQHGDLSTAQNVVSVNANLLLGSNQYILTSALPSNYRQPSILPMSGIPTQSYEAAYIGLATFLVSLIYLSPGQNLSESRIEKHLRTLNADDFVLGEKTERGTLARMQREGYIVKVRERGAPEAGGEDSIDYVVGPRGKVEIGERGVAGLVRDVHGDVDGAEIERQLVRNLGDVVFQHNAAGVAENGLEEINDDEEVNAGQNAGPKGKKSGHTTELVNVQETEGRRTRRSSGGIDGRGINQEDDAEGGKEGKEESADEEEEDDT